MKSTRFTENQIVKAVQSEAKGVPVADICREYGIHRSTFFVWKKKYTGLEVKEVQRLKELEDENRKLKQMFADVCLDNKILKEVIEKKL